MVSNADPRIHWLGTTECHDARRVGAKAAHLSRLAADFLVPPGFCVVPVDAAAGNDADEDGFEARLTAVSAALTEAYRTLAARCGTDVPAVAVRSSALDEDSAGASFAGQHATYLNVAGPEAVARSVAACWASARSAAARSYRARYGLVQAGTSMPVLVQQLVPADVSAVVFSVNPVSGDRGEVVVNSSWGYGESVVGGTVTPDAYAVRRADLAITGRIIADKSRMTVATAGGVAEVQTPGFLRSRSSLTDDQIREAARLACALEAAMGWPVDVECAWAGGCLFLLQCRPITAVGKQ